MMQKTQKKISQKNCSRHPPDARHHDLRKKHKSKTQRHKNWAYVDFKGDVMGDFEGDVMGLR